MSDLLLSDGHALPSRFGSPVVARRRGHARRWIIGAATVLVISGAAATQWGANVAYDDARTGFMDAADEARSTQEALARSGGALQDDLAAASAIIDADSGTLMPPAHRDELVSARDDADALLAAASEALQKEVAPIAPKPDWAWELFPAADDLDARAQQLADDTRDIAALDERSGDASTALHDTADTAVIAAAEAAAAFEDAHVNARNTDILGFRSAAADLDGGLADLDPTNAGRYVRLEAAALAMLESEKAELAEKTGPLEQSRREIEAFARELAPGLLLDFDWSATVRGYDGPSYGGWTQWWYADPGYANIALSDYVAEEWPAAWTKALVAHEVGHAISVKCPTAYDSSDRDIIEDWATAWAISRGFTDRSNGTEVYGRPPQSMVDAAGGCR